MVVAVAGNVDHTTVVRQVRRAFSRSGFLADRSAVHPRRRAPRPRPSYGDRGRRQSSRPFEQVNLVLGVNGLVRTDERRYALGVLNAALGGGTSSRLFQEVREHRGLAYSVYSYASHYADAGTGRGRGRLPAVQGRRRAGRGPRPSSAGSPTAGILRGRARSAARASCAAAWCSASRTPARGCPGSPRPSWSTTSCPASTRCCGASQDVTLDDVNALARGLFRQQQTLAVVGPFDALPG